MEGRVLKAARRADGGDRDFQEGERESTETQRKEDRHLESDRDPEKRAESQRRPET